MVDSTKEL